MSELDPSLVGFSPEVKTQDYFSEIGKLVSLRISQATELNQSFDVNSDVWKFDLEIDEKILTPENEKPIPAVIITVAPQLETPKTRGLLVAVKNNTDNESPDTYTLFGVHRNKRIGDVQRITHVDIDPEGFFGSVEPDVDDQEAANIIENLNLETIVGLTSNDSTIDQLLVLKQILLMAKPRVPDVGERFMSMISRGDFPRIITDF